MNSSTIIQRLKLKARKNLATPRLIAAMCKEANASLRNAGEAVNALCNDALEDNERRWIEAIESLRLDLSSSKETVEVPDYGAGSPSEQRSDEEMYEGQKTTEVIGFACRQYSKPRIWATLLFQLIRKFKPATCVELGTCLGVSAAYQAAALELNGHGRLVTLEGSRSFAEIARRNLEGLGLGKRSKVIPGRFQDTLDGVLQDSGKIDYAFIDGHHDEQATIHYFNRFLPYLSDQAVLVFDDIDWSPGMRRAWHHISNDPRVDVVLDFAKMGVCLVGAAVIARYEMIID